MIGADVVYNPAHAGQLLRTVPTYSPETSELSTVLTFIMRCLTRICHIQLYMQWVP